MHPTHEVTRRPTRGPALLAGLCALLSACGPDVVPPEEDCARHVIAFADGDGDGVGAGPPRRVCAPTGQPPSGLSLSAGDCEPGDATRFRQLPGLFRDEDGDGVTAGAAQSACVGARPETHGWRAQPRGEDCNDRDASASVAQTLHEDADLDGVGAGPEVAYCSSRPPPASLVKSATDCAPDDRTRWRLLAFAARDGDGDGRSVDASGEVCAGMALPATYLALPTWEDDCDDARADRWAVVDGFLDADGDGLGSGPSVPLCTGHGLPQGYGSWPGDCAPQDALRWQALAYAHRDADGDAHTVPSAGAVCTGDALPQGYAAEPHGADCDDARREVWVTRDVWADADADGVGAGDAQQACVGRAPPPGASFSGTDCEASDAARWQLLAHSARDADGDTWWVDAQGQQCSGAALPAGYGTSLQGRPDCDDTSPARFQSLVTWADADGDGWGAGASSTRCTGGTPPAGESLRGDDCAPEDAGLWQHLAYAHVDRDADGHTRPESGAVCTAGTLPAPYGTAARGNDCDDADAALWRWRVLYPDADGDGVGRLARQVRCLGTALPQGLVTRGGDVDDADARRQDDPDDALALELVLELP
jgi:hypothetical protein